jgi:hypothetical protein
MNASTLGLAAALAFTALAVRAQGDQSDIISQHGDALSRSTSAEALVEPKPTRPPNSAPLVVPSMEPAAASPDVSHPGAVSRAPAPIAVVAQPAPVAPAGTNSAASPGAASAAPESGKGRAVLVVIGALIALAMFLWERRSKD